jgi:hypothetical protein
VSTSTRRDPRIARLIAQGDFEALRLYVSPHEPLFQSEYFYTISKGIELLKASDSMAKGLLVFDLTNPFSFMLGLPPARGGLSWFHLQRTFSRKSYIHPDELFAKAEVIMVPKVAAVATTRDALLEIYGEYMRSHYTVAAENKYWTIWSRDQ